MAGNQINRRVYKLHAELWDSWTPCIIFHGSRNHEFGPRESIPTSLGIDIVFMAASMYRRRQLLGSSHLYEDLAVGLR